MTRTLDNLLDEYDRAAARHRNLRTWRASRVENSEASAEEGLLAGAVSSECMRLWGRRDLPHDYVRGEAA